MAADGVTEKTYFRGRAISFKEDYTELIAGKLYERVARSAIVEGYTDLTDWKVNFDHTNGLMMLGRSSSGTATMSIEADGVWFEVEKPNTTVANDLEVLIERGDVNGCSFHAICDTKAGDYTVVKRNNAMYGDIVRVKKLKDLSIVVDPAYNDTTLSVIKRNVEGLVEEKVQIVDVSVLRDRLKLLKLKVL